MTDVFPSTTIEMEDALKIKVYVKIDELLGPINAGLRRQSLVEVRASDRTLYVNPFQVRFIYPTPQDPDAYRAMMINMAYAKKEDKDS